MLSGTIKAYVKSRRLLRATVSPIVRIVRKIHPHPAITLGKAHSELFDVVEGGFLAVRVPSFDGVFEFGPHSHVLRTILIHRDYEPDLATIVKQRIDPNRDAIDIGANAGLFTVLMARLVSHSGRVLAIEPTPGALKYLRINIARHGQEAKVIIFNGVASDARKEYQINCVEGMEEYSSLGKLVHPAVNGEKYSQLKVQGETVDRLVDEFGLRPGFLKIDVEGAEYSVLMGALRTIQKHRPIVLCECDDRLLAASGTNVKMVMDFFESNQYDVTVVADDEIVAVPRGPKR